MYKKGIFDKVLIFLFMLLFLIDYANSENLTIIYPENVTYNEEVSLTIDYFDSVSSIWYSFDSGLNNITFAGNKTLEINNGSYNLLVYFNESDNEYLSSVDFTKENIGNLGNITAEVPSEWNIGSETGIKVKVYDIGNNLFSPRKIDFLFSSDYFNVMSNTELSKGIYDVKIYTKYITPKDNYTIKITANDVNSLSVEYPFNVNGEEKIIEENNSTEKENTNIIDQGIKVGENEGKFTR